MKNLGAVALIAALAAIGSLCVHAQQNTPSSARQDLSGTWKAGVANEHARQLKISKTENKYKAILYSTDEGWQAVANTFEVNGNLVRFAITGLGLAYTGTLSADGDTIVGTLTENGETHPLILSRAGDKPAEPLNGPPKPMPSNAEPKFQVVTVKRSKPDAGRKALDFRGRQLVARNLSMNDIVMLAYGVHTKQIIGAPGWFDTELFDLDGIPDTAGVPNQKQMGSLMQDVLTRRFGLQVHHEQRQLAVFAITLAKGGPKMSVSSAGPEDQAGFAFRGVGDLTVHNLTMADFAKWMQATVTDRPMVDQTGLKDRYDFTLKWTPDESQFAQFRSNGALPMPKDDPNAPPALNDAAQQQLGLRIERVNALDDVIVIDHANQPSAN